MNRKLLILFFVLLFAGNAFSQAPATDSIQSSPSIIQQVEKWYEENMNYFSITVLMTIESSFIPFPSEVVIPPAAYIASKPDSHLNIFLVVLFGTLGALIGAFINYGLAIWLGRPIMYKIADSKFGKLMLLSSEKIQKAEKYFNDHGKTSTFVGRLIPGIRQLISLPAGLARMNLVSFTIYTALGAGIWNTILALLGYIAHGQADLIDKYSHELSYIILGILGLVIVFYAVKFIIKKAKK
ncbi:MAG: DedA family protein [Bacteroidia bacterium]|nr:DedA family protein [Bacteroidia bacterium]